MKSLSVLLEEYLQIRRNLGADINHAQWLLGQFLWFLEQRSASVITTESALQWALEPKNVHPFYHWRRLAEVRRFARHAHAEDVRHEIPPERLLPYRRQRAEPHIYTDNQINALMVAAKRLPGRLRPHTYATVIGLLAVTGMRSGEVIRLSRKDVDLDRGVIAIHDTKYGKSRLVFCHHSTRQALRDYVHRRDDRLPCPQSETFFLSDQGEAIQPYTLRRTFVKLSCECGLRKTSDSKGPRLMDLRHTFTVRTLIRWYQDDIDMDPMIEHLSTWLGHVGIAETYWYFSAVPELMTLAARKLDRVQMRRL